MPWWFGSWWHRHLGFLGVVALGVGDTASCLRCHPLPRSRQRRAHVKPPKPPGLGSGAHLGCFPCNLETPHPCAPFPQEWGRLD